MINYKAEINDLVKYFGRRLIFNGINQVFESGNIYGVSGPNGSGKSTFVKIVTGLISATKGKVVHTFNDKKIPEEKIHQRLGFVSPYLFLYDEFTAEENLFHFSSIRGLKYDNEYGAELLNHFGIYERRMDLVKGYSSGMKQRLKFAFALLHKPNLIVLDEPTSNLDHSGKEKVYEMIEKMGKQNLVIIASNEDTDLSYCTHSIDLEQFKVNGRR